MVSINGKEIILAIFDMDGTILDSERIYFEKWVETAKILGYEMTREQWFGLLGTNEETEKQYLLKIYGSDCPTSAFRSIRLNLINEYADRHGMPLKRGFAKLSAFLHCQKIEMAVATSSERKRAEKLLRAAGVYDDFDEITCGDEVAHGKPSPELFLKAAAKAGTDPEKCIVLEDSVNGIEAANRAGMTAVCIPDMQPVTEYVKKTALVVPSFDALVKYFDF